MRHEITQAAVYQNLTLANRLQTGAQILFRLTGVAFDYLRPNGEEMVLGDAGVRHPVCEAERVRNGGWEACAACESRQLALAIERKSLQLYRCPARLNRLVLPVFTPAGVYIGALRTRGFELGNEPCRAPDRPVLNESRLAGVIAYLEQQTRILLEYQWQFESEEAAAASALRFESVTAHIRKNCMKELTLPATARKFNLSVSSFCRHFQAAAGTTFHQYLTVCRLQAAQTLLQESELPVAVVAFRVGFGSVSQFNRAFKAFYSESPLCYRKRRRSPNGS